MSEYIVRMPSDMPYEIKAELNAWYVNSEPIVRCRDCENLTASYPMWACGKFGIYIGLAKDEPDGFCAWGERKEVGE